MAYLIQEPHELLVISDQSAVGTARRRVRELASNLANPAAAHAAEIATSELANNILRHADGDGHLLIRRIEKDDSRSLEVLAVDRGPGIADVAGAIAGTNHKPGGLGVGLAAVKRMVTAFDLHTQRSRGTVVLGRFQFSGHRSPSPFRWGGVSVPALAFEPNGDGWAIEDDASAAFVILVDGLGHGQPAHKASAAALRVRPAPSSADPVAWLVKANETMRSTRGGVASIVRLDPSTQTACFAGVGNISGRILTNHETRALIANPGTLGVNHRPPRVQTITVDWPEHGTLVLWSDGLRSQLELENNQELLTHDPTVIAATLHRDHQRGRDDATVIVVQAAPEHRP